MTDLKAIRAHNFHIVYHSSIDKTALYMGDLPCLMMSGEHSLELLAIEYMSSPEWHDANEVWRAANPEYMYTSLKDAILHIRSLPVDEYGMAILPEGLK